MPHTDTVHPSAHSISQAPETAIVHLVSDGAEIEQRLTAWFLAAGLELRIYTRLRDFFEADPVDQPGCLLADADDIASMGVTRPSVAIADRACVQTVVNAMRNGAVDVLEHPICEQAVMTAVHAAIDQDRRARVVASRIRELQARFARLSGRERQVMALVTTGRLNKQVGGDLGLSEITIKAHRGAAMRKMGARSLADLVRMADAIGEEVTCVRSGCSAPVRTVAA